MAYVYAGWDPSMGAFPKGFNYSEVVRAIDSAEHLANTDAGSIALVLRIARTFDEAFESEDPELIYRLMNGPIGSFQKALNDLGLTAAGRKALDLDGVADPDDDW